MKLQILKCHGSGNDFILIDEYENILFSEEQRVTLSKSLCDRKGNLGADGILFFQKGEKAICKMRMFNPDGSEAEMCGNGLRCLGRYACEKFATDDVLVETLKSLSQVNKERDIHEGVETYQAELSTVSLNTIDIPIVHNEPSLICQPLPALSTNLTFTAVSMPNPHIVSIVNNISDTELEQIGEKANQLTALFPKGVNVNFCKIIDNSSIYVRTYERGVGLTKSCGSGMSASSLVSCLLKHHLFERSINVYNQGGLVRCKPTENNQHQYSVFLSGNATFMFSNTITFEFQSLDHFTIHCGKVFVDEIQNYGKLLESSERTIDEYNGLLG
jgi:diaminopimelate epimerase